MYCYVIPDAAVIGKLMADKAQEVLNVEKKFMDMLQEKHAEVCLLMVIYIHIYIYIYIYIYIFFLSKHTKIFSVEQPAIFVGVVHLSERMRAISLAQLLYTDRQKLSVREFNGNFYMSSVTP